MPGDVFEGLAQAAARLPGPDDRERQFRQIPGGPQRLRDGGGVRIARGHDAAFKERAGAEQGRPQGAVSDDRSAGRESGARIGAGGIEGAVVLCHLGRHERFENPADQRQAQESRSIRVPEIGAIRQSRKAAKPAPAAIRIRGQCDCTKTETPSTRR